MQRILGVVEVEMPGDLIACPLLLAAPLAVAAHQHCLHLFSCVDGHPLPGFSGLAGGVRSL